MKSLFITFLFLRLQPGGLYDVCPEKSQLHLRGQGICNATFPNYICVFDENSNVFRELCSTHIEVQRQGFKTVLRGSFDSQKCDATRYQPYKHISNIGSDCVLLKSHCNEEGQVLFDIGTSTADKSCRCDYTRGYAYVQQPYGNCKCIPSMEDCTCFRKSCQENRILTPDYSCISKENIQGNFICPPISRSKNKDIIKKETVVNFKYHNITDVITNKCQLINIILTVLVIWLSAYSVFTSWEYWGIHPKSTFPKLTVDTKAMNVDYGKSVDLPCAINAFPQADSVHWEIVNSDGSSVDVNTNAPEYQGGNTENPSLHIKFCTLSDTGLYRCVATNTLGSSKSQTIQLTVRGGFPEVIVLEAECKVQFGERLTLDSCIESFPQVSEVYWEICRLDGTKTIVRTSSSKYIISYLGNPSLTINSCQLSDTGLYRCAATNAVGTTFSQSVTVTVKGGLPKLNVDKLNVITEYGKTVVLLSTIEASPPVHSVHWEILYLDGTKTVVNENDRRYQTDNTETSSLEIMFCKLSDSGQYRCVAENATGVSFSRYTTLNVSGGLPKVLINKDADEVQFGDVLTLQSFITSRPQVSEVYWEISMLDGTNAITGNSAFERCSDSVAYSALIIKFCSLSNAGHYRCVAKNDIGTTYSQYVTVTVIGALPKVTVDMLSKVVNYSKNVELNCLIKAFPPVQSFDLLSVSNGNKSLHFLTTSVTVFCGDRVQLPCVVLSQLPIVAVYWERNINGIITQVQSDAEISQEQIQVRKTGRTIEFFVIASCDQSYAGEYRCLAFTANEKAASNYFTLYVDKR